HVLLVHRELMCTDLEVDTSRCWPACLIDHVTTRCIGKACITAVVTIRIASSSQTLAVSCEHETARTTGSFIVCSCIGCTERVTRSESRPTGCFEQREENTRRVTEVVHVTETARPVSYWINPVAGSAQQ